MMMTRRYLVGVALGGVFAAFSVTFATLRIVEAVQADTPQIAGHYFVVGNTSKGKYRGEVQIYQKGRAVYFRWNTEGGSQYGGFGLITGSSVAVGFAVGEVGVAAVYRIEGERLIGEYPDGDGSIHTETISKDKPPAEPRSQA